MFQFIKKCFFTTTTFIICNFLNVNFLECFLTYNQEGKIRTELILPLMSPCFILILLK